MSAEAILIAGNTGAGKSTYAARLALERGKTVIFSVDHWMKTLYMADMPDPPSYEWALERTQRVERQMLHEALQLLAMGISVILDIGFFEKSQRQRVLSFFRDHGHQARLHYLDVDKQTRWRRVNQRNTQKGETYQFEVPREIFDFCETIFEALDAEERQTCVMVDTSGSP